MERYAIYASEIENLACLLLKNPGEVRIYKDKLKSALNGGPTAALRKCIPIEKLQQTGTFFTGEELAKLAAKNVDKKIFSALNFYDPACGAGDLLISAARRLPISQNLNETLLKWGEQLHGHDLHSEFVRTTKARLILTAFERGIKFDGATMESLENFFPNIKESDGLSDFTHYPQASCILINPPYHHVKVPKGCTWAGGKVSAAALFLDICVSKSKPGTKIIAILPDVLRSGTFYQHWRENIESKAEIEKIELFGKFDRWTEVDVFILTLTVSDSGNKQNLSSDWWKIKNETGHTIADFFEVSVGRVVPYRDAEEGPEYDYIQPKTLPKWEVIEEIKERRKFSGKVTEPPFVAIRRNSRFDDKKRAVATVINSLNPVAVENHLMILKPKDGKAETCNKLLEMLKFPATNTWLNQRIRCRHLTVPAIEQLPWIVKSK